MKNFKKFAAVLLASVMTLAALCMPIAAATLDDMSFTPPAGWSDPQGVNRWFEKGEDEIFINPSIGNYDYSVSSVRGQSEGEWAKTLAYDQEYRRGLDDYVKIDDVTSSFATVNGYEYIKVEYSFESYYYGITDSFKILEYVYIDSSKNDAYTFIYRSNDSSMAHRGDFNAMMQTVTYGTAPQQPGANEQQQTPTASSSDIKIYVNGSQVFPDSAPIIENSRTLVPIRVVAEALGYGIEWDGRTQSVSLKSGDVTIGITIGASSITIMTPGRSTQFVTSDVLPKIINDRTYLPLRAVAEAMGCTVDWNGSERAVYITK